MGNHMDRWKVGNAIGEGHATITPHNTNNLDRAYLVLVNTAGDVAVVDKYDVVKVYHCTAGFYIPITPKRINSTNTTGGIDLIGIY